jgi:hypothetical protein
LINALLYQAGGYTGIFCKRACKLALSSAQSAPAAGLKNQPRGAPAFSVDWGLQNLFASSVATRSAFDPWLFSSQQHTAIVSAGTMAASSIRQAPASRMDRGHCAGLELKKEDFFALW